MKMKKVVLAGMVLTGFAFASCSKDADNVLPDSNVQSPVVTARLAAFEGKGQLVDAENAVNDMQACLFEGGVMTKVYTDLQPTDAGYNIQLDRNAGNLYMLANTEGVIDLEKLRSEGITEQEWLSKAFVPTDGKTVNFFTGSVSLDGQPAKVPVQTLSLYRGIARFDLVVDVAGSASIKQFKVTNVAQSAYLFPQDGVKTPADAVRKDAVVTFDSPLTQNTPSILYAYEQENENMTVSVDVSFDGQAAKTLSKPLSGSLKRNTIYTITVRKDDIDIVVKPVFEDWGQGGDTELVPNE